MNTYVYKKDKQILFVYVAESIIVADIEFEKATGLNLLDKNNWVIGCELYQLQMKRLSKKK